MQQVHQVASACVDQKDMLIRCSSFEGVAMGVLMGQILLGVPFIVFAYWYEQEEALFQSATTQRHTAPRHGAFGLFFSVSFAILGMMFFPPLTGATALLACIYIFVRSLDNIEHHWVSASNAK
jgi:hypothetical protein